MSLNQSIAFEVTDQAKAMLAKFYGSDLQSLYKILSEKYSGGNLDLEKKLYEYACKGWFGYSSPILTSATGKGLPISCFLLYVPDSIEGLVDHTSELRWLSVLGGGVAGHWDDVRGPSQKSCGTIPFLHTVDADMSAYWQGKVRRGSYAAYMSVSHPDLIEFITMRTPTGDVNRKNLNLHHGVNITDAFMRRVERGLEWDLIDPDTGAVMHTVQARELWERMLETRFRTGEPYLNFIDASNRALHPALKRMGLRVHGSNLCNEIHLPTSAQRTAVCCLSSVNLEKYDEWRYTDLVECLVEMLDNVLQLFIDQAPSHSPHTAKAVFAAKSERSIGLGAMGWARYLQKRRMAFDSAEAERLSCIIFGDIKSKALSATRRLAKTKGEAPDLQGYGVRNAHLLAVAPNANSALLLGTSPSVEPEICNAFVHRTRAGSHQSLNPYLRQELAQLGMDKPAVWDSIISNKGSVQHLEWFPDSLKQVYKTAFEMDQAAIVRQAGQRQKHLCQGQSLNLFFPSGQDKTQLSDCHRLAWKVGCKGLYYLRTCAARTNHKLFTEEKEECKSCQG
ncbi:ribonucleotide reductase alpha subunit [Largemouth bass virus]|uniref:Ribonucleotide reductase large subunit n=1 Tax=Largemouth bass virus TaxID=176656 RepID=A0A9E7PRQ3_9VIRU|nr:ribonucleotide reductase alpha subunit [Largemouth bass virus]WEI29015.1 ribonucleotide reductase alpha subunit [Largemouth bass virus]WHA35582.1 putative ribonucleotide reductase alpha subunit [Micropterus salmoides ranavirus]WHA35687.1 putative ribonucleotide reductase alpha subunit [Siniperca chuatsi ranavirus]